MRNFDENLWQQSGVLAKGDTEMRNGFYIRLRSNQLAKHNGLEKFAEPTVGTRLPAIYVSGMRMAIIFSRNNIPSQLFICTIYLMVLFSLAACDSSSDSGSSDGGEVEVVAISASFSGLPYMEIQTFDSELTVDGYLTVETPNIDEAGEEYLEIIQVNWENPSTMQSGFSSHEFSGRCAERNAILTIATDCFETAHESSFSFPVNLDIGFNAISIRAKGEDTIVEVERLAEGAPARSPDLYVTGAGVDLIQIQWFSVNYPLPDPDDTFYNLYYATASGVTKSNYSMLPGGTKLAGVVTAFTGISPAYNVTGLDNDETYYFIITAENVYGEGPASDEFSMTTLLDVFSRPPLAVSKSTRAEDTEEIPSLSNLSAKDFIDLPEGWIFVDGNRWVYQSDIGDFKINDVSFTDSTTGWAISASGVILGTNDGGASWQVQHQNDHYELHSVSIIDSLTVSVVGSETSNLFRQILLETSDGGLSWDSSFDEENLLPR
jgi:hypothetical protein